MDMKPEVVVAPAPDVTKAKDITAAGGEKE